MKNRTLLFLSGLWILATLSLAGWWIYTFQVILTQMEKGAPLSLDRLQSYKAMILWEGVAWMLLLLLGGGGLVYYILKEKRDAQKIKEFMAAFSHDLKTSLASMRLQAESLEADIDTEPESKVIARLIKDTVRLQFQLENTMAYSSLSDQSFTEKIVVGDLAESLRHYWPSLRLEVEDSLIVNADKHKVESILKNAIQNALVHGKATQVFIHSTPNGFSIRDNGLGFQGELDKAGELFYRHKSTSGTGLGLYIIHKHVEALNGTLSFPIHEKGFEIVVQFPQGESS